MIRKVIVFGLSLFLLCGGSMKVFAEQVIVEEIPEEKFEVRPLMDFISRASCDLYINSTGKATIDCSVYGYQGTTTKISITANLQQYKGGRWVTIKNYTESANSHRLSLYETTIISKGYDYRVTAQVKAYSGLSVETRNLTSSEVRY